MKGPVKRFYLLAEIIALAEFSDVSICNEAFIRVVIP